MLSSRAPLQAAMHHLSRGVVDYMWYAFPMNRKLLNTSNAFDASDSRFIYLASSSNLHTIFLILFTGPGRCQPRTEWHNKNRMCTTGYSYAANVQYILWR